MGISPHSATAAALAAGAGSASARAESSRWTTLFSYETAVGGELESVAKRLFLQLEDHAPFSRVCRDWHAYDLVLRRHSIEFLGDTGQDRYRLLRVLLREDVEKLYQETGRRITWPVGARYLKLLHYPDTLTKELYYFGRGNFGVFTVGFAMEKRQFVGIKMTLGDESVEEESRIQDQLRGLRQIMPSLDRCTTRPFQGQKRLFQVMELAGLGNLGSLRGAIQGLTDPQFQEELIWHLDLQFLEALSGMHRRGYYHLDVKLENAVVDRKGKLRTIDFGCTGTGSGGRVDGREIEGDTRYFSPERWVAQSEEAARGGSRSLRDLFRTSRDHALCDGARVDAWAAGASLLELTSPAEDLFDRQRVIELNSIADLSKKRLQIQDHFLAALGRIPELADPDPTSRWAVIKGLLEVDPARRLSVQEALERPYFAQNRDRYSRDRDLLLRRFREFLEAQRELVTTPRDLPLHRTSHYVQRLDLQRQLREQLLDPAQPQVVLQGAPGVGKSELARQLIHDPEIERRYDLRLWFRHADRSFRIEEQFISLAREFSGREVTGYDEAFRLVQEHLSTRRWIAVFDGVEGEIQRFLPTGGKILITTRSRGWRDAIPVGPMTGGEAQRLQDQISPGGLRISNLPGFVSQWTGLSRVGGSEQAPVPLFGIPQPASLTDLYRSTIEYHGTSETMTYLRAAAVLKLTQPLEGLDRPADAEAGELALEGEVFRNPRVREMILKEVDLRPALELAARTLRPLLRGPIAVGEHLALLEALLAHRPEGAQFSFLYRRLGDHYRYTGHHLKALPLLEKAVAMSELSGRGGAAAAAAAAGGESVDYFASLSSLGVVRALMGDLDSAYELLSRAKEGLDSMGEGALDLRARCYCNLSVVLFQRGEHLQAVELIRFMSRSHPLSQLSKRIMSPDPFLTDGRFEDRGLAIAHYNLIQFRSARPFPHLSRPIGLAVVSRIEGALEGPDSINEEFAMVARRSFEDLEYKQQEEGELVRPVVPFTRPAGLLKRRGKTDQDQRDRAVRDILSSYSASGDRDLASDLIHRDLRERIASGDLYAAQRYATLCRDEAVIHEADGESEIAIERLNKAIHLWRSADFPPGINRVIQLAECLHLKGNVIVERSRSEGLNLLGEARESYLREHGRLHELSLQCQASIDHAQGRGGLGMTMSMPD